MTGNHAATRAGTEATIGMREMPVDVAMDRSAARCGHVERLGVEVVAVAEDDVNLAAGGRA